MVLNVWEAVFFDHDLTRLRGIADRAYRESLGLTAPEFVDLRRIEVQKEIVQHSPSALTVIMGLERIGINLPPFGADK